MNIKKACVVGLVLAASSVASAATYYISPVYGDDDNGDGLSMETAFKSLSKVFGEDGKARGNLAEGSTVVLSNGTYALDVPLELYKTTLKGWTGNPKDVILDGQDEVNCVMVKIDNGACTLSGVTVMRGKPWGPFVNQVFYGGAGVYIGQSSSVVTNCIVRDCTQPLSGVTFLMGGGVMVTAGKVVDTYVENCHVRPPAGGRGYGGGICLYGSNTSAVDCTVTNCSIVATEEAYGGGIGNYFEGYDPKVTGCVVVDCALTNSAGVAAGTGGGISVTLGGEIRDCLVRNCTGGQAQVALIGRNGADYAAHKSLVSGCTIEGGSCRPLHVGCSSDISNATVENTLIQDVTWTPSSSATYGYGILVKGSNNRILSSVVRNCESVGDNGAHAVYIGADTVVSNCVIEQCKTLSDSGTAQYSGAIAAQFVTGLQIVDSIIQSNESYRSSSAFVYGNGGTATGLVVRGCYFFANKSRNTCGIYAADNRPHIFDHCTFAGNTGGEYFRATGFGGPAENWFVNACVFAGGNCTPFDYDTNKGPYPISYCNVTTEGGTRTSPVTITKTNIAPADMKFVDSAAKDYRQIKGSAGVDVDTSAIMPLDWAQQGNRRRLDLGDGTFTLEKLGKHGITIVHNQATRRWSGTYPDIGCFELYQPLGLMLLFK